MNKKLVRTAVISLITGCFVVMSCGGDPAGKTQGFTQSLEQEQQKADDALETLEEASEALDKAADRKN